jgi:hypothetical protein
LPSWIGFSCPERFVSVSFHLSSIFPPSFPILPSRIGGSFPSRFVSVPFRQSSIFAPLSLVSPSWIGVFFLRIVPPQTPRFFPCPLPIHFVQRASP